MQQQQSTMKRSRCRLAIVMAIGVLVLVRAADVSAETCRSLLLGANGITSDDFTCVDTEGCCERRNASAQYLFFGGGDDGQSPECVSTDEGLNATVPYVCYSSTASAADYEAGVVVPTVPDSDTPLFTLKEACAETFIPSREQPGRGWCVDIGLSPSTFVGRLMQLPPAAREAVSELIEYAPSLYADARCLSPVCPYNDIPFELDAAGKAHAAVTAIALAGLAAWAALGVRGSEGWSRERLWLAGAQAASLAHCVSAAVATTLVHTPQGALLSSGAWSVFLLLPVTSLAALCVVVFARERRRWRACVPRVSAGSHRGGGGGAGLDEYRDSFAEGVCPSERRYLGRGRLLDPADRDERRTVRGERGVAARAVGMRLVGVGGGVGHSPSSSVRADERLPCCFGGGGVLRVRVAGRRDAVRGVRHCCVS